MYEIDFDPDNPETMPDAKPRLRSELKPLLPCPFCGEIPKIVENHEFKGMYHVSCQNVMCDVAPMGCCEYSSKEDAINGWNTRAR